jgi:hypothetical protein
MDVHLIIRIKSKKKPLSGNGDNLKNLKQVSWTKRENQAFKVSMVIDLKYLEAQTIS